GYYACTSFADWNVGRIMDAIENSEHKDNTIFILITDNGFHVGAKNHWEKNTLWDASALSPMFIKLPGGKPMRVKTPVSLLDIYPTLVELCGLESPDHQLAGQSLSPILANKTEDRDPVITTFGEGLVSLRTEKFRYISYPDGTEELYDVEQDPYEWNNLISEEQYAEEVQRLREHLPVSYAEELPGRRN
ncbi:MAG: sulfatase-like hydrolase/transferase, partial [Marinoscillum sp.]